MICNMLHIRVFLATTAIAGCITAEAQQPPAPQNLPAYMGPCATLSCEIQNDWTRNNLMVLGLARAMPEDKYGFKPVPEEQTFGERVLHVAQINLSLLQGLGAKTPPPALDPKATSKTEAMAALQKVGDYGIAVIREFTEQQLTARVESPWFMGPMSTRQRILYFLMMHNQDTYGQLVVYARLNGIIPPASRLP
jgi:uncharacterized damage-inducible protein DinB